jgi:hypothetical protein
MKIRINKPKEFETTLISTMEPDILYEILNENGNSDYTFIIKPGANNYSEESRIFIRTNNPRQKTKISVFKLRSMNDLKVRKTRYSLEIQND